jgi:uncharacterized delta-60 repeat protein
MPAGVCRRPVLTQALSKGHQGLLAAFVLAAASLLLPTTASAATFPAGVLDPGFGDGGIVKTSSPAGDTPKAMVDVEVYRDGPLAGKLVAAGYTAGDQLVLARFNPDGSGDGTFGDGGYLVHTGIGVPKRIALDDADRILVATAGSITRFTPDGNLDTTFGACHCGQVTLPSDTTITAIAADVEGTDAGEVMFAGRIAAGVGTQGFNRTLALAGRLTASGDLRWQRSFAFTDDPASTGADWSDEAAGIGELPGGKTVVGGDRALLSTPVMRSHSLAVARLLPDGSFDPSFGSGGAASYAPDGQTGWWATTTSIAVDSAGGVLVASKFSPGAPADCGLGLIMRVDADGALDSAFGNDSGFADQDAGGNPYGGGFDDIAIDSSGRILTAGRVDCHESQATDAGVHRLTGSGQPDLDFNGGEGDLTVAQFSGTVKNAYGLTVDSRGPVIAGEGGFGQGPEGQGPSVVDSAYLARFLSEPTEYTPPSPVGDGGVAADVSASPGIDVHRLITAKTWRKLIKPGVRVLASCDRDCRMDVTVTVSNATAHAAGLGTTTVARGSARASAGDQAWISAKAIRSVREALRAFEGDGRLHVAVTASAP